MSPHSEDVAAAAAHSWTGGARTDSAGWSHHGDPDGLEDQGHPVDLANPGHVDRHLDRHLDDTPRLPPTPVKIIVSGGFGVGKTTFIGSLSDIEPLTTEAEMTSAGLGVDRAGAAVAKTTTTVAMDFGRVAIDDDILLYLFGTPGQDRFGFMWNDLVEGALGGVVMVDPDRLGDCFVALDFFERRSLPFVVAVNRFAGREELSLDVVREAATIDPHVPVVEVDARDREPVKQAVLALLRVVLAVARTTPLLD